MNSEDIERGVVRSFGNWLSRNAEDMTAAIGNETGQAFDAWLGQRPVTVPEAIVLGVQNAAAAWLDNNPDVIQAAAENAVKAWLDENGLQGEP